MALYLPYLHWDTYKRMIKRREFVKKRLDQGRARPTPKIDTTDLERKTYFHTKLIFRLLGHGTWSYFGSFPPPSLSSYDSSQLWSSVRVLLKL
jgi:hypothetical protein